MKLLIEAVLIGIFFALIATFYFMFLSRLNDRRPSLSLHRDIDNKRRKWGDSVEITTTSGIVISTSKKEPEGFFLIESDAPTIHIETVKGL